MQVTRLASSDIREPNLLHQAVVVCSKWIALQNDIAECSCRPCVNGVSPFFQLTVVGLFGTIGRTVPSRVAPAQKAEIDFATILNRNTTDQNVSAKTNRHGRVTVESNVQVSKKLGASFLFLRKSLWRAFHKVMKNRIYRSKSKIGWFRFVVHITFLHLYVCLTFSFSHSPHISVSKPLFLFLSASVTSLEAYSGHLESIGSAVKGDILSCSKTVYSIIMSHCCGTDTGADRSCRM